MAPDDPDLDDAGLEVAVQVLEAVTAISADLDLDGIRRRVAAAATALTGAGAASLELLPARRPAEPGSLVVPVVVRGVETGALHLAEKSDGHGFTERDERVVRALARAAGQVVDNARAYGVSERRRQWLEATAELLEALQPPVALERALRAVTALARSLTGARATAVLSVAEAGTVLDLCADVEDRSLVEEALARVGVAGGPRTDPVGLAAGALHAVVAPMRAQLGEPGVLVVLLDRAWDAADHEAHELLATFADQAGLALDRALAVQEREETAVSSDRERIARDLHDVVIQRLFATGLQLQRAALVTGDPEVTAALDQAVTDLDLTIKDIRGSIFDLQNRDGASLRGEVRRLVHGYAAVLGFAPALRTTGPLDIAVPAPVARHLLAVLREALSNVARHAAARHADVEVCVQDEELRLTVADDGTGAPAGRRESGLRNARERATALGGELELESRRPGGTTLVWRVPLS